MGNCRVKIYYSQIQPVESSPKWHDYMQQMSLEQQKAINRYVYWEDRCRTLFGKILLKQILEDYGYTGSQIKNIQLSTYGRPYLPLPIDFNISHAGDYVICAASKECKLGIDIEEWNPIDFREFRNIFTQSEWHKMNQIEDKIPEFFRIWTQKESVIKADGRGLSLPLNKIEANDHKVVDNNNTWFLSPLNIGEAYSAWLATGKANPEIELLEKRL